MEDSIKTYRLQLDIPSADDYATIISILADGEMTLHRETDFSVDEIILLLNDSYEALSSGDVGLRIIKLKDTNEIIGIGGIKKGFLIDHEIYEALIYLAKPYWRKGYAKEALRELMKEAFEKGINPIHSFINMDNYNMQFVLEALGYKKLGDETINLNYNIVTRAHYIKEKDSDEAPVNDNMFFVNF